MFNDEGDGLLDDGRPMKPWEWIVGAVAVAFVIIGVCVVVSR